MTAAHAPPALRAEPDLAICGAGPVGMTLAALLVRHGVAPRRLMLIDARPLEQARQDPRSIALSYGSRQLLEQAGAWPAGSTPIREVHVSRRGHLGRTLIRAEDYRLPALGYVSRYGEVVAALADSPWLEDVPILRPARITASTEQAEEVRLQLADGGCVDARLLVQAEGGLFTEQHAKSLHRSYDQSAIVAHVRCSAPLPQRAFERFTGEGPLALLPQGEGYALIWCVRPATAARLLQLPDAAFLQALGTAFGTRLGRFTQATPRLSFALGLNAAPASSARTLAIGNAAQTLHPVAGQGLNLGLRDAAVLARLLAAALGDTDSASRLPLAGVVQAFTAARATDRQLTIRATDGLARLFASAPEGAFSQALLGASLSALDLFPPARHLLAGHMMYGQR